jgi:hypothetical protein
MWPALFYTAWLVLLGVHVSYATDESSICQIGKQQECVVDVADASDELSALQTKAEAVRSSPDKKPGMVAEAIDIAFSEDNFVLEAGCPSTVSKNEKGSPIKINGVTKCNCVSTVMDGDEAISIVYGMKLGESKCRLDHDENGILSCFACSGCCAASTGKLCVKVINATNLPDMDGYGAGASDAFVEVTVGGIAKETPHVPENLNPVFDWEECFEVDGADPTVVLAMKDYDQWFNFWYDGHDHIHTSAIDFHNSSVVAGEWTPFTRYIDGGGSFNFELKYNPTPASAY